MISGPAGIIARLDTFAQQIIQGKRDILNNNSAKVFVTGFCDGCVIVPDLPTPDSFVAACTSDSNCPPNTALPLATLLWNYAPPAWCNVSVLEAWRCLTAPVLLQSQVSESLLVHAEQYDVTQVAAYGAWPLANASKSAARNWTEQVSFITVISVHLFI